MQSCNSSQICFRNNARPHSINCQKLCNLLKSLNACSHSILLTTNKIVSEIQRYSQTSLNSISALKHQIKALAKGQTCVKNKLPITLNEIDDFAVNFELNSTIDPKAKKLLLNIFNIPLSDTNFRFKSVIHLKNILSKSYNLSIENHTEDIKSLHLTSDNKFAVASGYDNQIIIWDLKKKSN